MKKRVRKRKTKASAKAKMKQDIKRNPAMRNAQFIDTPAGVAKMSDRLDDLIEPYVEAADTDEAYTNLVTIGVIAWNTAVLPRDQLDESLAMLGAAFPDKEDNDVLKSMLLELMKRKLELFPDDHRLIMDFTLTQENDGWHLQVAATLPPAKT